MDCGFFRLYSGILMRQARLLAFRVLYVQFPSFLTAFTGSIFTVWVIIDGKELLQSSHQYHISKIVSINYLLVQSKKLKFLLGRHSENFGCI